MINIVIPMAGAGSRFAQAGYTKPKPFIDVAGKPMIARVMENLRDTFQEARFILIARGEHMEQERALVRELEERYNALFVPIEKLTEGAACTVLFARAHINDDTPLLIANSDQIVDASMTAYVDDCTRRGLDGSILTFRDPHKDPKWSFARIDDEGIVQEVREKQPISDIATVGIYYFAKGRDYVDAAIDMIVENDRVKNEFYVCPVYNYGIRLGKRFGVHDIPFEAMHGIGTPEDLALYLKIL